MTAPLELHRRALAAFDCGDWPAAYRLASQLAAHAPRHPEPHFIGGVAALQLQQVPLAIAHLQIAASAEPARADHLAQYARALAMAHRLPEAVAAADRSASLAADDAVWDTLGVVYSKANAHEQAAAAFRRAAELAPGNPNHRFNLATSHMYFGDFDAAEREYEACIGLDPANWRAYLALSQLRRQTPGRNHVERLRAVLAAAPDDASAHLHLHLSLAKEHEDLGQDIEAFDHYVAGKAAWRRVAGSSAASDAALFDAIERRFDAVPTGPAGHASDAPIFVIGMPRSGTTLVDRVLSAHPQVQSAGELGHFGAALHRMGGGSPRSLAGMVDGFPGGFDRWAELGASYIEDTRPLTGGRPRFVDKLPHNFLFAGFIARALPDARIICLRRDPMDTCLSNFRQLFAPESPWHGYSFDLLDTGRYYLRFDRLMKHWHGLFPGRILDVRYEDLVDAQEATTRTMLDFCGLDWNEACLRFERSRGAVPTASAVQVRSSLNRDSIDRCKRYGPRLEELRRLLATGGIAVD
jgi:tetratricopeptide (TPR) repeat protein